MGCAQFRHITRKLWPDVRFSLSHSSGPAFLCLSRTLFRFPLRLRSPSRLAYIPIYVYIHGCFSILWGARSHMLPNSTLPRRGNITKASDLLSLRHHCPESTNLHVVFLCGPHREEGKEEIQKLLKLHDIRHVLCPIMICGPGCFVQLNLKTSRILNSRYCVSSFDNFLNFLLQFSAFVGDH